jgi:hypothetical protein
MSLLLLFRGGSAPPEPDPPVIGGGSSRRPLFTPTAMTFDDGDDEAVALALSLLL